LDLVVLDDQHPAHRAGQLRLQRVEHLGQLLALDRFDEIADRAQRQGGLAVVAGRDHVDRDVPGRVVALEAIQDHQARFIGQSHVQHHGAGLVLPGQLQRFFGGAGHQALEAQFAGEVAHDAGELVVVLDHQQHAAVPANLSRSSSTVLEQGRLAGA
jgi:uncharacterized protein